MKYLIYARVSERGSDWEGESSCSAQIAACREHLSRVDPSATFGPDMVDEFITGRTNDRPALNHIMSEVASGRADWDALAVLNIDRLTRSMEGYIEILRVLSKHGKGLIAVRQNLDLASPSGRFMLQLLVSAAEYFAHLGAENTRAKMLSQARQGQYLVGQAPFGYDKGPGNVLVQNVDEAVIVRDIFERYSRGETITEIRRVHPIPKNTIAKMLHNQTYIGKIVFSGDVFNGLHEPIISADVWAKVQVNLPRLAEKTRPQRQRYDYMLAGLIRCTCGRSMSPATCTGKSGASHPYYRCQDSVACPDRKYIRADKLEKAVLKVVAESYRDPNTVKLIVDKITERLRNTETEFGPAIRQNKAAIHTLATKRDSVMAAFTDGLVTHENAPVFNAELSKLNAQLSALEANTRDMEAKTEAAKAQQFSSSQIIKAWTALSARLERCDDIEEVKRFVRSTVTLVQKEKDGWKVSFLLPSMDKTNVQLVNKGSTSNPEWHTSDVLIELFFVA